MNAQQRTVYVVTSGSYSGYGIEAIYSTLERAEAHPHADCGDDLRIEEYVLDQFPDTGPSRRTWWSCRIDLETGEVTRELAGEYPVATFHARSGDTEWHSVYENARHRDVAATATSYVSADHARKLAIEARQGWLREMAQDAPALGPAGGV